MSSRIFPVGISVFLGWASCLSAATLYVDSIQGKDANKGTEEAPFRTIAQALKNAGPGDTVLLVPGQPPIHEGAIFHDKKGEEGRPITLDGGGNVLIGSRPIDPTEWKEAKPGLYRREMKRFLDKEGKMLRSMSGRYFLVTNGAMNRMGRASKGGKGVRFKAVGDLAPGEWTFVADENAFYIATADGASLADLRVEEPLITEGVATRGSVEHIVVKNLTVTRFLNDGYNFHGTSRNVLIKDCAAIECGDDGMSAHSDCHVDTENFVAKGNSTGICHINESCSRNDGVTLLGNVGVNLYLIGSGTHTFKNLKAEAPIWLGNGKEEVKVSFTDSFLPEADGTGTMKKEDLTIKPKTEVEFLGKTPVLN